MSFQYDSVVVTGAPERALVQGTERPATVVTGSRTGAVVGAAPAQFVLPRRAERVPVVAVHVAVSSGGGGGPATTRWEILTDGAMNFIWAANDLVYVEVPI